MKTYRPAGNPIHLHFEDFDASRLTHLPLRLYHSGTASLAAAILGCRQLDSVRNEVILPGYACPDLLSAIIHAGAKPVLLDLEEDSYRYDPDQLAERLGPQTLAVISIRFMGLDDDLVKLGKLCKQAGARLIIDSAQWFPCHTDDSAWPGDYHILSFGRGKPVNLLHGGAVISHSKQLHAALPNGQPSPLDDQSELRHRLKILAYNQAIRTWIYGLVTRLPGLHVGETVYRPLESIEVMSRYHRKLLNANIDHYRQSQRVSTYYRSALAAISQKGWKDLTALHQPDTHQPLALLRYPLLIESTPARKSFVEKAARLGVSRLYQEPLPGIRGVADLITLPPSLPRANRFAHRLVTLPTHEDINREQAERIVYLLEECL